MKRRSSQLKSRPYAVAKRKSEKFQACWDKNPDLCDTGAVLK